MKRTAFRRPEPPTSLARVRQWSGPTPTPRAPARSVLALPLAFSPQPKENAVECEEYRRLVAARPCIFCGIVGFSQAAHPNTRKAKGLKADDRLCFPLCCTRALVVGCHYRFDQHQLFTRDAAANFEAHWGARTREAIDREGLWPAQLPRYA